MGQPHFVEMLCVFGALLIGFTAYVVLASKAAPRSPTFFSFFLGGRRIGRDLTTHSNWGLGFSFSNGVWFCALIAYKHGWWIIPLQVLWSLSIVGLGLLTSRILLATANGETIHGFVGAFYGRGARFWASLATTIGYILNCGFEVYFSALILCATIGLTGLTLPVALLTAGVAGAYCMIGGYAANARTDKPQNIIGMLAASALAFLFMQEMFHKLSVGGQQLPPIASPMPPIEQLIGLFIFLGLFNLVDMANWQMIAANREIPLREQRALHWSFIKSALYQLAFPSLVGALIGWLLQVRSGVSDNDIIPVAFAEVFTGAPDLLRGAVWGLIFLGLFSCSLSSADTYLLAAAHTLAADVITKKRVERLRAIRDEAERLSAEATYISKAKLFLIPLALAMVGAFAAWYMTWPDSIFQFQFIMYGSALALLPCALYALNAFRRPGARRVSAFWAAASVIAGIIAGIASFYVFGRDLSSLSPLLTLAAASLVFSIGLLTSSERVVVTHEESHEDILPDPGLATSHE